MALGPKSRIDSISDIVFSANVHRYSDGIEVEGYLSQEYHRRRIAISKNIMTNAIGGRRIDCLVDLGGGAYSTTFSDIAKRVIVVSPELDEFSSVDLQKGIPLGDETADIVFAGEIIEHIFDTKHFLSEVSRITKRGGLVVFTTPNLATIQDRWRFLLGYSPRHVDALHGYRNLHIRPFTFHSLRVALEAAALTVVVEKTNYIIWDTACRRITLPLPTGLFRRLGGTIIMSARNDR